MLGPIRPENGPPDPADAMTLAELTARIAGRAAARVPPSLAGTVCILDFSDEGLIRVRIDRAGIAVDNEDGPSDCRLRLAIADFLALARGEIHPQKAVLTGRVKASGDLGLARQLAALLDG
jgi:ubiquinone biosynthesis protein UbiJ